jgi:dihydropteroate synthase
MFLTMPTKDTFFSKKRTLNLRGAMVEITQPVVMGILNVTPDSFYDGGSYIFEEQIIKRCEQILTEGALIIDIGAYSSRPGAEHISEEEELHRLNGALKPIRARFPDAILSVDTFRAGVARQMVENWNVQIVNDISAGELDLLMMETVADLRVPYIMMHMKGSPQNMQQNVSYDDYIYDLLRYFSIKVEKARQAGIKDVILDPGFGFSKTLEQNYQLLRQLSEFRIFELPLLVGVSRKSMIYKTINTDSANALAGTVSANTLALLNGADILRVHDVKEAVDAIQIVSAYKNVYI